uniref:Uncharacterized protein n=1 Tax=Arundo donax TaxID=35708 RepID=A0A0A8ZZG5_ARUDO
MLFCSKLWIHRSRLRGTLTL